VAKDGLPASGVASAEFPATGIPRKHHLELWRRACDGESHIIPLSTDWGFLGDIKCWSVADLLITRQHITATRYERTPEHVKRSGKEWLLFWYVLRGSHSMVIDDRVHHRWDSSNLGVHDWGVPHVDVASDYDLVTIAFPRSQLAAAELMGERTPVVSWGVNSAQGQLLRTTVDHLLAQLPHIDTNGAAALASGFTGLLDGILLAEAELLRNRYLETSRSDAMKQFVTEHLRDSTLGVHTLCERFHCSRATVYRLFEDEGGVASYIQRQRLHACMRELTRIQNPPKGVLEQVASAWGFSNSHRFSRLFRAQFDLSPQEALRAQAPAGDKQPGVRSEQDYWRNAELLNAWMANRQRAAR